MRYSSKEKLSLPEAINVFNDQPPFDRQEKENTSVGTEATKVSMITFRRSVK